MTIQHRSAKTSSSLNQDQRLAWIHELLIGSSDSLPYRVAGMLLLIAEALATSTQVAFLHADKAAEPWARYAGRSITSS